MSDKYRILVVDDDEANRLLLEHMLTDAGCEVLTAQDGPECLDLLTCTIPDLIILDVLMPGPDGFEVCRRIKADKKFKEVPVIFITGLEEREDFLTGFEAGGTDFIPRPFDRHITIARVKAVLEFRTILDSCRATRPGRTKSTTCWPHWA